MKILNLLLAAASFFLTSCLEIKSTLIVSKDGTATIEESVLLGAQLAAMMQAGGGQAKLFSALKKQGVEDLAQLMWDWTHGETQQSFVANEEPEEE